MFKSRSVSEMSAGSAELTRLRLFHQKRSDEYAIKATKNVAILKIYSHFILMNLKNYATIDKTHGKGETI